ncbi:MAG: phosphoglycolate phosphatase [Rhodobacteraceae bacterium]|nr:phosphoglycolate phosphatase [Paracoccaceae bacterium]
MKAAIFDLDGTLLDSAPDIINAANLTLDQNRLPLLAPEVIRGFVGNGIPKLVERLMRASGLAFEPDRHAGLVAEFVGHYTASPSRETTLYPNVRLVLEELAASGVQMGICTNKDHALTLRILADFDLLGLFAAVHGGDSLPVKKPDPAPLLASIAALSASRTIYIGDSEVDAATASAAAVPFVLFAHGYRKSPVAEIAHDYLFDDFHQLPAIVSRALAD